MRVACVVGLGLSWPAVALAEPTPVSTASLSFVRGAGAEACPDARELSARVERRLGRAALVLPAAAQLAIEARIAASGNDGYFVEIGLSSASGERLGTRRLEAAGPDCEAATDSAALAIALMIDPEALSRTDLPEAAPTPAPPAAAPPAQAPSEACPAVAPAAAPGPAPCVPEHGPWQLRLSAGASLRGGALPGVAPGGWLGWRILPSPRWAMELSVSHFPTRRQRVAGDAGVELSLQSADARGWWLPVESGRWSAGVAPGVSVGSTLANGYGFTNNRVARSWLVAAQLTFEVRYAVASTVGLLLRPGLEATLWHVDFTGTVGQAAQRIYEPSSLRAGISLGVELGR